MTTKYEQVLRVHRCAVETGDADELGKIPAMLNGWGIKCREDDGQLLWTNLSIPTSVAGTITIGLRYLKQDSTLTEDAFELSKKEPSVVNRYYKGRYDELRPEYQGTHKQQNVPPHSFTSVNTCCLYLSSKK